VDLVLLVDGHVLHEVHVAFKANFFSETAVGAWDVIAYILQLVGCVHQVAGDHDGWSEERDDHREDDHDETVTSLLVHFLFLLLKLVRKSDQQMGLTRPPRIDRLVKPMVEHKSKASFRKLLMCFQKKEKEGSKLSSLS